MVSRTLTLYRVLVKATLRSADGSRAKGCGVLPHLGMPTSSRQGVTVRCLNVLACADPVPERPASARRALVEEDRPVRGGRFRLGRGAAPPPSSGPDPGRLPLWLVTALGVLPRPREFGAVRLGAQSWEGKGRGGRRPSDASPCNPPGCPERRRGVRPSGGSAFRFGRGAVSAASGGHGASSIHPPGGARALPEALTARPEPSTAPDKARRSRRRERWARHGGAGSRLTRCCRACAAVPGSLLSFPLSGISRRVCHAVRREGVGARLQGAEAA